MPEYFTAHEPERPSPGPLPVGKGENTHRGMPFTASAISGRCSVSLDSVNALFLSADIFNSTSPSNCWFRRRDAVALAANARRSRGAALPVRQSDGLCSTARRGLVYGQCATVDLASLASKAQPCRRSGGTGADDLRVDREAALFPMHFWCRPPTPTRPAGQRLLSALVVKGSFYILSGFGSRRSRAAHAAVAQLFGLLAERRFSGLGQRPVPDAPQAAHCLLDVAQLLPLPAVPAGASTESGFMAGAAA